MARKIYAEQIQIKDEMVYKHGYEYEKLIYGNKLLLNVRYK